MITLIENVCSKADEIIFNMIANLDQKYNHNFRCLIKACKTSSLYIIESLLNMKFIPNIECFISAISIKNKDKNKEKIIKILLDNGLKLTDEIFKFLNF